MNIYIGIDPSINSTGIVIQKENQILFYIVKPNKLSKKEAEIEKKVSNFKYVLYNKIDLSKYKDKNYLEEQKKTENLLSISNTIKNIINSNINKTDVVYIVEEGISYGSSIRTKSVFDLAGLNYLIRSIFFNSNKNTIFFIGTPSEIKKFATGKGNANKEMMKKCFAGIFPEITKIQKYDDLADAYFMSEYAKKLSKLFLNKTN